jgi:hypothetical protein
LAIRELEVQRDEIDVPLLDCLHGGLTGIDGVEIEERSEDDFEGVAGTDFILHDEDGRFSGLHGHQASGVGSRVT